MEYLCAVALLRQSFYSFIGLTRTLAVRDADRKEEWINVFNVKKTHEQFSKVSTAVSPVEGHCIAYSAYW